jgi:hypothetical protein
MVQILFGPIPLVQIPHGPIGMVQSTWSKSHGPNWGFLWTKSHGPIVHTAQVQLGITNLNGPIGDSLSVRSNLVWSIHTVQMIPAGGVDLHTVLGIH